MILPDFKDSALRLRYQVHRHGVPETSRKIATLARDRVYLDESHIWYELALEPERPPLDLPPGIALVRAKMDDIHFLDGLPYIVSPMTAARRLSEGNDLWFALEGQTPAFSCWTFRRSVPVVAAPGGFVSLPPQTVFLEDSNASVAYRGRNVAVPTLSQVCEELGREGVRCMLTKVLDTNVPAQRFVTRLGFQEFARTHLKRKGLRQSLAVRGGPGESAGWLAGQLTR